MRNLRLAAILTMAFFVSCVATVGPRYYLTETPKTIRAARADSVLVHIDDKLMVQMDALLLLGRKEQLEQAACLRVDPSRPNTRHELWVDSLLRAAIIPDQTTIAQIVYSCDRGTVPLHDHVIYARDGWEQCVPSAIDMAPGWSRYPAAVMQCGIGPDSVVAWKAKP